MTDTAGPARIYVDANPFIYFVEGEDTVARHMKPLFELLRNRPGIAVTSELTLAEVLPKARDDFRRSYFELIVRSKIFDLQPVTREILIDTADYRRAALRELPNGQISMPKLPDVIHVMTAARCHCRMFLSADGGLRTPTEMTVFEPNEPGIAKLMQAIA